MTFRLAIAGWILLLSTSCLEQEHPDAHMNTKYLFKHGDLAAVLSAENLSQMALREIRDSPVEVGVKQVIFGDQSLKRIKVSKIYFHHEFKETLAILKKKGDHYEGIKGGGGMSSTPIMGGKYVKFHWVDSMQFINIPYLDVNIATQLISEIHQMSKSDRTLEKVSELIRARIDGPEIAKYFYPPSELKPLSRRAPIAVTSETLNRLHISNQAEVIEKVRAGYAKEAEAYRALSSRSRRTLYRKNPQLFKKPRTRHSKPIRENRK